MKKVFFISLYLLFSVVHYALADDYYLKPGATAIHQVTSWATNVDGSGSQPSNFTAPNQTFIINRSDTLFANLTISGSNSKIIVGDGTQVAKLTLKAILAATVDVANFGILEIAVSTNPTLGTLDIGSTVVFAYKGDQTIPSATYYNLSTEIGFTKSLADNTTIRGLLRIGPISMFNANGQTLTFEGTGKKVLQIGTFLHGNSTVKYADAGEMEVAALNYYNLDITGGKRILEPKNIIGIANEFTPGAGPFVTQNSTVEYNTTDEGKSITPFSYSKLRINSSANLEVLGDVTVTNHLVLLKGKVTIDGESKIIVTNSNPLSVSKGNANSYIIGTLQRKLDANMSNTDVRYTFPVGKSGTNYNEIEFSFLTTGSVPPEVAVSYSGSEWKVDIQQGTVEASASVALSSALSNTSSIQASNTSGSGYVDLYGSRLDTTIVHANITSLYNFYKVGTRIVSPKTYYYTSGSINNPNSWNTSSNGSGYNLPNFTQNDVTYIINKDVTTTTDLYIEGSNSILRIIDRKLTVNNNIFVNGSIDLESSATLDIKNSASVYVTNTIMANYGNTAHNGNRVIDNYGTLTVGNGFNMSKNGLQSFTFTNESTGIFNLHGNFTRGQDTYFTNKGISNICNSNILFSGNSQLKFTNAAGGIFNVFNDNDPTKKFTILNVNLSDNLEFQYGSDFNLYSTNFHIGSAYGILTVKGNMYLQDSNFDIPSGGATITVDQFASLYMFDTDNNGDGVIDYMNGGLKLNVHGTVYTEGVKVSNGGGTEFKIKDEGTMFIGDVGLHTGLNNNSLTVENGGTLNYCGNKTPHGENLGSILFGGTLNYAQGYYTTQTPVNQGDFTNASGGRINPAYASHEACREAFYSPFSPGEGLLPIELMFFTASCSLNSILVEWHTASETNNQQFILLKSTNGHSFYPIYTTAGAGNSVEPRSYSATDVAPAQGINYYQLKQIDYNGASELSPIIAVQACYAGNEVEFEVIGNTLELYFNNLYAKQSVALTNVEGKLLYARTFSLQRNIQLPLHIAPGVYIATVTTDNFTKSMKVVVK